MRPEQTKSLDPIYTETIITSILHYRKFFTKDPEGQRVFTSYKMSHFGIQFELIIKTPCLL